MRNLVIIAATISLAFSGNFERNNNTQTVAETKSGLIWEDDISTSTQKISFKSALIFCNELRIDGMRGWRLPSSTELATIIDTTRTPTINQTFRHTVGGGYWSSDKADHGAIVAWIDFLDGSAYNGSGADRYLYVRCVRK